MSNNFDPFYGEVQYFKGTDLDSFTDPLVSMDGMISDIKLDCKIILEARLNRNPDMINIIFDALKNIVRLFQGICYLRLRNSAYGDRQDRLFFWGILTI